MKFSELWLREWVDPPLDSTALGEQLTRAGLELESITPAPSIPELPAAQQLPGDRCFDVALTPNRGDCLSIQGMAREVATLNRLSVRPPVWSDCPVTSEAVRPVHLASPAACPRYLGRIIEDVDVRRQTPPWMQWRLRLAGIHPLSVVVDITNYVMLELGQPLHAFDQERLQGTITVREAGAGETLRLLDGEQRTLHPGSLLIADQEQPLALAGIMGGEASALGDSTRHVFLECAWFAPQVIVGRARRYGLHTEASHRFERGVDPALQAMAIERASALILEHCGGRAGPVQEQQDARCLPSPATITLRVPQIERLLGVSMDEQQWQDSLKRLGMRLSRAPDQADAWQVTVPSWRLDLRVEANLLEELVRLQGYEHIPRTRPRMQLRIHRPPPLRQGLEAVRQTLVQRAYQEVVSYSFVDPALQTPLLSPALREQVLPLSNPISEEMAVMRASLWPGLLQAARYNQQRQQTGIRLFEIGKVFLKQGEAVVERLFIGGLILGKITERQWYSNDITSNFYDIKADVQAVLQVLGIPDPAALKLHYCPFQHPAFIPGQCASLSCGGGGPGEAGQADCPAGGRMDIGLLGGLHPRLCAGWDLPEACQLFALDLEKTPVAPRVRYRAPTRTPAVRRDLALLVQEQVPAEALFATVRSRLGPDLAGLQLFDVYRGKGVPSGQKSLALSLIFQRKSGTLTDSEVEGLIEDLLSGLRKEYDARLRE